MAKNLVSDHILAHLTQIRATKLFFSKICLRQSLDIMVSYRYQLVQYQKTIMTAEHADRPMEQQTTR